MESLEDRIFLSADAVAALISPSWFADFTRDDAPRHVNPADLSLADLSGSFDKVGALGADGADAFDWIVQFDTASLAGLTSADQTADLLDAVAGVQFDVLRGLGLAGQVVVRSSGASAGAVADWFAANVHVATYELDVARQLQVMPNDSQVSALWGMHNTGQTGGTADADIDAPEAWNISTGSSSIVVGVIDTGVDYNHVDLAANIWTNPGEIAGNNIDDDGNGFVDDVHGYDFHNNDGDPMDDNNHGTHVSGTIAGAGNNGTGVAGVNWSSSIMGLKFLSAGGSGYTSNAVRAVNYATMMRTIYGVNVRVTSNSWGGGGYSSAMNSAIQASGDAGILFVAAAGNSSSNNDSSPHYPSNYALASVLAVAATDHNDALASFSSYGANTVHLGAPGRSVYSTVAGGGYASYSGTSMATPHVSGVAALAWSVDPDATVAEIRDAILQGTDSLVSLSGRTVTGGRLNAFNTLQLLGGGGGGSSAPQMTSLSVNPNPIYAGTTVTLTAAGVSDSDGTVTGVTFYRDTNVNGQWDAGDQWLGTDTTIVNSQAVATIDTTAETPGNVRFFARAQDNESNWSVTRSTVLVVTAPDDHGNDAGSATPISPGQTLGGAIDPAGEQDWFSFDAVAGTIYQFSTELVTMPDSMLYLYDQDGVTLLDSDDDGGVGLASMLGWGASTDGTYFVAVKPFPNSGPGSYRLTLTTTLDDHGSTAGSATSIAVQQAVAGSIQYSSDLDYFALQAPVNRDYTVSTQLLTLDDSVLYVYDQDGTTLITWDDDGGPELASRATWTGIAGRTYYVAVEAYETYEWGTYTLYVDVANVAPVLAAVADRTMSHNQDTLSVAMAATDADSDAVTYSATVLTTDPLAELAYQLDQQLGLNYPGGNYYENARGAGEKYMQANDGRWFFIMPNGELYHSGPTLGSSTLVGTLSAAYHADPTLLHNAQPAPAGGGTPNATVSVVGNTLTIDPVDGFTGNFQVQVSVTDGIATDSETFQVSVTNSGPVLPTIGDRVMSHNLDTTNIALGGTDPDGDALTYTAQVLTVDPLAQLAYDLDQQLGLRYPGGNYYESARGAGEKYMQGNDAKWYFIMPNGELYHSGPTLGSSTLIDTLSAAYHADPTLLHDAQPVAAGNSQPNATVSLAGNVLTIDPVDGFVGNFQVQVSVTDGIATDDETFQVSVTNSGPVLTAIGDRNMSTSQDTMDITLAATDSDGDALTYTAQAITVDPLAQLAYDLDQQLGLRYPGGNYYTSARGAGEKYMQGNDGKWYFIMPTGELYHSRDSLATSTLMGTLSAAYHADPTLLHDAQPPAGGGGASDVTLSLVGNVLTIDPADGFAGNFQVQVMVTDGVATDGETFQVSVTNLAPVLAPIGDRAMSYSQDTISITLAATDADGDPLTYTAQATMTDPLAQLAYDLDQQFGLRYPGGNYYTNARGAGEKYMQGNDGKWYFIMPTGELYHSKESLAASTLVGTLSAAYHADPTLLHDAQPVAAANAQADVTLSLVGNVLTIDPADGFAGNFQVQVMVTDGVATDGETFQVSVTNVAPVLAPIGDRTMSYGQDTMSIALAATDGDGDALTYTATAIMTDPLAQLAYDLDQQIGLRYPGGNYYTNARGAGEKYMQGSDGKWYFIMPNGELYLSRESLAASTLVGTLDATYHADPTLLHNAQPPAGGGGGGTVTLSLVGNLLTIDPADGFSGDFQVRVDVTDGAETDTETFLVSVSQAASVAAADEVFAQSGTDDQQYVRPMM